MENLLSNTRKPDITFYRNGRIDISAHVVKALELQRGDSIGVTTDGYEYLLYVTHRGGNGRFDAMCMPSSVKKSTNNFRAHSVRLSRAVRQAIPVGRTVGDVLRLPTGKAYHSTTLDCTVVPLITHNPL